MNTTANRLTHAVMIAAALAACFMAQQTRAAQAAPAPAAVAPATKVVMLPKVVVTGKRVQPMQVVYLPRVEVTGKHVADSRDTMQAKKDGKAVLVAMR
jgi:hypothetical protein